MEFTVEDTAMFCCVPSSLFHLHLERRDRYRSVQGKPKTLAEMDEGIARAVKERQERSRH